MHIQLERHRNPLRLEVVRQAIPFGILLLAVGVALGYAWAMKAYGAGF